MVLPKAGATPAAPAAPPPAAKPTDDTGKDAEIAKLQVWKRNSCLLPGVFLWARYPCISQLLNNTALERMWNIRQSGPDSGLGLKVKVVKTF